MEPAGIAVIIVAFDVFGTLVDPIGLADKLASFAGEDARPLAELWRRKQIEYAFRRSLMRRYVDFTTCTHQAFDWAVAALGIAVTPREREAGFEAYTHLPPYPDAAPALDRLRRAGVRAVAFSNGTAGAVDTVLRNAGLRDRLEAVISVDAARAFKPAPEVYAHLVSAVGGTAQTTWLVSANAWDALGAQSAGVRAVWVRRDPAEPPDPWEIAVDAEVGSLEALPELLEGARARSDP